MLALYLATAACGVVLIGVSVLLGGSADADADLDLDADVDVDVDVDVDADVDVDGDAEVDHDATGLFALGSWLPFLSMRFWTFFVFSFGLSGSLLTFFAVPWLLTLLLALGLGFGLGWAAALFFKALLRDQVTGDTGLEALVGREATVVLNIREGARGKIAIESYAGRIELLATSGDGRALSRGERVLVAHVQDGVADVTRLAPDGGRALPDHAKSTPSTEEA